MNTRLKILVICPLLSGLFLSAYAEGTAFTYQGRLNSSGTPVNGSYDFRFRLDADALGNTILATAFTNAVPVANGLFTTTLDFGAGWFNGSNYWLEVDVRTNGAGSYTVLTPLQPLTPTPYAVFANTANTASNLSGTLPVAQLSPGTAGISISGSAASFTGNLSGDVTGTQNATAVASVGGQTAGSVAAGASAANAATSANVANTIVKRDASGTFSAGTVLAGYLSGNGSAISNVDIASLNSEGAFSFTSFNKNITFSPVQTIPVGYGPACLAAADVNGDGLTDLVTANYVDNTLTVLTNTGTGLLRFAGTLSVGLRPLGLTAVSVHANNKTDLVCANYFDNNVMVLTNNGTGVFSQASTVSVGAGPVSVVSLDINGDGYPDLVVANGLTNTLSVLLNDSHGSFYPAATLTVGNGPRQVTALQTTTGLGVPQIFLATANQSDNTVSVLTNYNFGTFALMATLPVGSSPDSVALEDINGDGYPDIVCANIGANNLSLLLNNHASGFYSAGTVATGNGPAFVAVTDFNADDLLELVVANLFTNTLTVLSNYTGSFFPVPSQPVGKGPTWIAIADFNGDHVPDLAVANRDDNSVTLLSGNRAASFNGNSATATKAASVTGNISDSQLSVNIARLNGSVSFAGTVTATNFQTTGGSFIAGAANTNGSSYAAIGGGLGNYIQSSSPFSTIGGGNNNLIQPGSTESTIGGGGNNLIWALSPDSTIGGGHGNAIMSVNGYSVIGGGGNNTNSGLSGTVGGGSQNVVGSSGLFATVAGGGNNTANGLGSTVPGGENNLASGSYSFAAGQQAQATNDGAFVWADAQGLAFGSTRSNQFLIRAQGGVGINMNNPNGASLYVQGNRTNGWQNSVGWFENTSTATNAAPALRVVCDGGTNLDGALSVSSNGKGLIAEFGNAATFVVTITNDGTIYCKNTVLTSDRNGKENFTALDAKTVLAKVASLPMTEWNYKDNSAEVRHIGPMAQDFHAAFALNGADDTRISTVDEGGVALAAIQGLNQKLNEKDAEIQQLQQRLDRLEQLLNSQSKGAQGRHGRGGRGTPCTPLLR